MKIQPLSMCCNYTTIARRNAHFHPGDNLFFFASACNFKIHIIFPSLGVFSFENGIWALVPLC